MTALKKPKSTKSRSRALVFVFFLLLTPKINSANGVMPIDDAEIKLPDGRILLAKRDSGQSHWLILKLKNQTLWIKRFELEYDRVWAYAFFVPVKKGHYIYDLNRDGSPEVAVATWDGGNNIANRYALVFSVKNNSLRYYDRKKFNLEYGEYVYR